MDWDTDAVYINVGGSTCVLRWQEQSWLFLEEHPPHCQSNSYEMDARRDEETTIFVDRSERPFLGPEAQ